MTIACSMQNNGEIVNFPFISMTTRRVNDSTKDVDEPKEPVIRLKLDNPPHWDWQLTTTADALPVIQLVDKDGKLLVETSGRVAQRARGSFRDGLKTHESFPESLKEETTELVPKSITGNRNFEGFSTKYGSVSCGFQPRKSRSEATVTSAASNRRKVRKRHSSTASELDRSQTSTAKKENALKRYSVGDYLRKQILEDLCKQNDLTPNEIARNRYKKMKEYLRSQSDGIQRSNITPEGLLTNSFKDYRKFADEDVETMKKLRTLAGKQLNKEDLDKIRKFLQTKIQTKMEEEKFLYPTSSFPIQHNDQTQNDTIKAMIDNKNEIKKRYSDCARDNVKEGSLRNYRTRKIRSDANIRFNPDILEASNKIKNTQQKIVKKNSSGSEKKKVYRKTKSDLLLSYHMVGSSLDSEKECPVQTNYPTQRIKSQDNFERSWREYKERKKQERFQKEADHLNLVEEDFMKKPRWKDFQNASCQIKTCKVCENMKSCIDPMKDSDTISIASDQNDNERPETSLQENYLMIDPRKSPQSKVFIEEQHDQNGSSSPDFGYNSISKHKINGTKGLGDSCANSNVKKSDTFKIIDGGDGDDNNDAGEVCYDYRNKTNEDIARDYFRRVYELLRRRQEEAKKLVEGRIEKRCEDTSSSNYLQEEAQIKRRRRPRKMDKSIQGN